VKSKFHWINLISKKLGKLVTGLKQQSKHLQKCSRAKQICLFATVLVVASISYV